MIHPGQGSSRNPALDGLRALAILLVLQYHVFASGSSLIPRDGAGPAALDRLVINVFSAGWAGVDLFFVLSGFLITGILLDARDGEGYFGSFYARRFLRIFPLYYAFLFFIFFVYPLRGLDGSIYTEIFDVRGQDHLWFLTYTQNIPMAIKDLHRDGNMPMTYLWSLAVEEQFYIVWPLIVFVCPRRLLPGVCIALCLAALGLRWHMVEQPASWSAWNFSTYFLTPARMDTLAAGALIACLVRGDLPSSARPLAAAAGVAAAAMLAVIAARAGTLDNFSDPVRLWGNSLIVVVFAAALFLVVTAREARVPLLSAPLLAPMATYSYAIYVLHPLIFTEIAVRIEAAGGFRAIGGSYLPALLLFDAALVSLAFAAGWLSWNLLEERFLRLKRHFPYGAPRAAAAAAGAAPVAAAPVAPGADADPDAAPA